jgi:hypothetical protein
VVGCPGVARSTVKSTALLFAGTVNDCPLAIGWPLTVTRAFWNVPKRNARGGFGFCVFEVA